jgi:cyanophycin synthetase
LGISTTRIGQVHHGLHRLRPAVRRENRATEALRQYFYRDFWAEAAAALDGEVEDLGAAFLRIATPYGSTFVRNGDVELDDGVLLAIAGDKGLVHRLLVETDVATPDHVVVDPGDLGPAEQLMARVGGPIVVKPVDGHGGAGVTTGITTRRQLRTAAYRASWYGSRLLAEAQVHGSSYRLLYLGGELVDAIRFDPPTVIGDGRSTISQLVAQENETRLEGRPPTALRLLRCDTDMRHHLADAGLTAKSVPGEGSELVVKQTVNENAARDTHRVLSEVHPSFHELGRSIRSVLPIDLLGVDVITPDVGRPLAEAGGAVHELNTTPAPHHHHLIAEEGERAPVGALILAHVLGVPSDTVPR